MTNYKINELLSISKKRALDSLRVVLDGGARNQSKFLTALWNDI